MPKRTNDSSKSFDKHKKPYCVTVDRKGKGRVTLTADGPVCRLKCTLVFRKSNGVVATLDEPMTCEQQAAAGAEVARNTCLLNGGLPGQCQIVYDETYEDLLEECQNNQGGS